MVLTEKELFVKQKVNEWIQHLETLSDVADEQPQAAYCAFTMSFQAEWIFLQRVFSFSSIIVWINGLNRQAFVVHITSSLGWINIKNPVKTSSTSFETSSSATRYLVLDSFESETHNDIVYHAKEL